jgi:hypothetical protein
MGQLHIILKVGHPKIISTQISEQKNLCHLLVNVNYFVVHSTGLHLENPNKDDFIQSDLFYKTHDIEDFLAFQNLRLNYLGTMYIHGLFKDKTLSYVFQLFSCFLYISVGFLFLCNCPIFYQL